MSLVGVFIGSVFTVLRFLTTVWVEGYRGLTALRSSLPSATGMFEVMGYDVGRSPIALKG